MHCAEYKVLCQLIVKVTQLRTQLLAPNLISTALFEKYRIEEKRMTQMLYETGITEPTIALIGRVYTSGALQLSSIKCTDHLIV